MRESRGGGCPRSARGNVGASTEGICGGGARVVGKSSKGAPGSSTPPGARGPAQTPRPRRAPRRRRRAPRAAQRSVIPGRGVRGNDGVGVEMFGVFGDVLRRRAVPRRCRGTPAGGSRTPDQLRRGGPARGDRARGEALGGGDAKGGRVGREDRTPRGTSRAGWRVGGETGGGGRVGGANSRARVGGSRETRRRGGNPNPRSWRRFAR